MIYIITHLQLHAIHTHSYLLTDLHSDSPDPDYIWIIQPITRLNSLNCVPDWDTLCSFWEPHAIPEWCRCKCVQIVCGKAIKETWKKSQISYNRALWLWGHENYSALGWKQTLTLYWNLFNCEKKNRMKSVRGSIWAKLKAVFICICQTLLSTYSILLHLCFVNLSCGFILVLNAASFSFFFFFRDVRVQ